MVPKRKKISEARVIKKLTAPSRSDKLEARLDHAIDAFSDCVNAARKYVEVFEATLDPADILPALAEVRKAVKRAESLEATLDKLEALESR